MKLSARRSLVGSGAASPRVARIKSLSHLELSANNSRRSRAYVSMVDFGRHRILLKRNDLYVESLKLSYPFQTTAALVTFS